MSVTANGDRMKTALPSFSHTEVAHGSLLQRDFLEEACTLALLGALAGDAYPYLAGIVVFIEPHHLPFFLVEGVITGYCARVRRNLQIDGRYGEPFMVVVIGSPLGTHRDDTVGSQKKSSFSVQRNSIARPSFTVTQVSAPLSAPVKVMPSMRTVQEATLAEIAVVSAVTSSSMFFS